MVSGCQKDIDAVCGLNTTGGLLGGMKLFILGLNLKSSAWGFGVDFSEDNEPTDELGKQVFISICRMGTASATIMA